MATSSTTSKPVILSAHRDRINRDKLAQVGPLKAGSTITTIINHRGLGISTKGLVWTRGEGRTISTVHDGKTFTYDLRDYITYLQNVAYGPNTENIFIDLEIVSA